MVLRSGIIIPFQFRDTKKLLMIGVPEENRNLNIWDLKNVGKPCASDCVVLLLGVGVCELQVGAGAGAMIIVRWGQ